MKKFDLLGCDKVPMDKCVPAFPKNILLSFSRFLWSMTNSVI